MRKKKQPNVYLIHNEKEAKAYLHPVRMRILQFLTDNAMTVSRVAEVVGVHPANLTHHFRKLLNAGLIRLVEERDTGRVIEKYYRSVARSFQLREENVPLEGAGNRALRILYQDMRVASASLPDDARDLICLIANARLSNKDFARFQAKLEKLMAEFRRETERTKQTEGEYYSLNLSLYPRNPGL